MTSTNRPNLKRRATQRGAHENVNVSYYASPLQHQRTPKRSRLNDTPLSPSREHGNTSTEGWSTLSQVEESRWSWDHEEPIHEGVASTQHIYDEPQNNLGPIPSLLAHIQPGLQLPLQVSSSHYAFLPQAPTLQNSIHHPSVSTPHNHTSLLASSFSCEEFIQKAADPAYDCVKYMPRGNNLPAAYSRHRASEIVHHWCSRCWTWIRSSAKDPSKHGKFDEHLARKDCLAAYALHLGLDVPLLPGQQLSIRAHNEQSISIELPPPAIPSITCPGVVLPWKDDIFDTYVWHEHASLSRVNLPWEVDNVHGPTQTIRIRSKRCDPAEVTNGKACSACVRVLKEAAEKFDKVSNPKKGTNDHHRSYRGLHQVARKLRNDYRRLDRKWENLKRHVNLLEDKLKEFSDLVATISSGHVPRVDRIIKLGLERGSSPAALRDKIMEAMKNGYQTTRGYVDREINAGLLAYCIGGARMTFALHHAFGTPSLKTIKASLLSVVIKPCLKQPDESTMARNLKEVVDGVRKELPLPLVGCHIAIDETALVPCAMYVRDQNAIGGICPCSPVARGVNLTFNEYADVECIRDGLRPPEGHHPYLHFASQATVAAVTVHDPKSSHPMPFLVSGGCGKKSVDDSVSLFEKLYSVWESSGMVRRLGWFWSVATDGDSSRRRGGYTSFLSHPLSPSGDLWKVLHRLQGLNLFVGPHDVTLDFDWKHIIKRMSTCIRGKEGMSIRGRVITPGLLAKYLKRCGYTSDKVDALLQPDDAQNVICAIELIKALQKIHHTLKLDHIRDPAERQEIKAIRAFARVYGSFVMAFTDHTLSLKEQMRLLSMYSHMAVAIYRKEKTRFVSTQLYADSQTCVKNVFFCLAKQQLRDSSQPFYLFMNGSDGVERLFAMMRMIGGHKPNVNLLELCQNLSRGMDIQRIFAKHPKWYMGHRRMSTSHGDKADHLSAQDWMGDVRAGAACLLEAWNSGAEDASRYLREANFTLADCDFVAIFAQAGVDILRPSGDGYVGVPTANSPDEEDRSMADHSGISKAHAEAATGNQEEEDLDDPSLSMPGAFTPADDELLGAMYADSEAQRLAADADDDEQVDADDNDCNGPTPTFTDLLHEASDNGAKPLDGDASESGSPTSTCRTPGACHYVEVDGRKLHKASVIRILLNELFSYRQSKDRLVRVRGFAGTVHSHASDNIPLEDAFSIGSVFATLLHTSRGIALALLRATQVFQASREVTDCVRRSEIPQPEARIILRGQVLSLVEAGLDVDVTQEGFDASSPADSMWMWNEDTVQLPSRGRPQLVISVHGFTATPVVPPVRTIRYSDGNTSEAWVYTSAELQLLLDKLWTSLCVADTVGKLAKCAPCPQFPYHSCDSEDSLRFMVTDESFQDAIKGLEKCSHCCKPIRPTTDRVNHVGRHLIRLKRGIDDAVGKPMAVENACGFCGKNSNPLCQQLFLKESKSGKAAPKVLSSCPYFYKMSYNNDKKFSRARPCTNVPIVCEICNPPTRRNFRQACIAYWKYEMEAHIRSAHPRFATPTYPNGDYLVSESMAAALDFDPEEEEALGVSKTIPWTALQLSDS